MCDPLPPQECMQASERQARGKREAAGGSGTQREAAGFSGMVVGEGPAEPTPLLARSLRLQPENAALVKSHTHLDREGPITLVVSLVVTEPQQIPVGVRDVIEEAIGLSKSLGEPGLRCNDWLAGLGGWSLEFD